MLDFGQAVDATRAIRSLVASGVPEKEIHQLVTSIGMQERGRGVASRGDDLPIYDELPPGLIDLPSAADLHDRSLGTLHTWIRRGRLPVVGRLRASARGGGRLLIRAVDIARVNEQTPRRNR